MVHPSILVGVFATAVALLWFMLWPGDAVHMADGRCSWPMLLPRLAAQLEAMATGRSSFASPVVELKPLIELIWSVQSDTKDNRERLPRVSMHEAQALIREAVPFVLDTTADVAFQAVLRHFTSLAVTTSDREVHAEWLEDGHVLHFDDHPDKGSATGRSVDLPALADDVAEYVFGGEVAADKLRMYVRSVEFGEGEVDLLGAAFGRPELHIEGCPMETGSRSSDRRAGSDSRAEDFQLHRTCWRNVYQPSTVACRTQHLAHATRHARQLDDSRIVPRS